MATNVKTACYHCGEDCGTEPVMFDEKPFCCYGCKTVYEILKESDACDYYNIDQHPGIKIKTAEIGNKYAYLDNEEIRSSLLEFSDGGISKVTFFIPSIHCSSCIWLLENLHRLQDGIIQATVNFIQKKVTITYREDTLSLRRLVELLGSINYVPRITLDTVTEKSKKKADRSVYYKLGVAGFCFGNIMLFSFPEYLAVDHVFEENLRRNFSWLNLLFSLPVMFYAATGYLVSAYKGLRKKIVNIDVPIALGIIVLFTRSAYEIISGTGAGYMDSLSGLVFFLLIGKWYQGKTYQALSFERDYNSYFPVAVTVLDQEGKETYKPLKSLKIGDRILVRNQELIPADAILVHGNANIDYSFVSGESTPVPKQEKELIFAGGRQIGSAIELIVEKEVTQSYLTELWNQDLHGESSESRLTSITNVVSQYFTIAIISIAVIAGGIWLWLDPSVAMNAFTSVLIVACPCALALTIPFAFGSAMRIFGRNGFYLKKTGVLEQLSKTEAVVFDKTGTLTRNDDFEVDFSHLEATGKQLHAIRAVVRHSTHPLSIAIYRNLPENGEMKVEGFSETVGSGVEGRVGDDHIKLGSGAFTGGTARPDGNRSTKIFVSLNDKPAGYVGVYNKYREGLKDVIGSLDKEYELHLLSGDNDAEKPRLMPLFKNDESRLNFRQTPVDKLKYIKHLKESHRNILMIGDGLNDAGALKESDTGITIADDIYHFSPACDAILESDKFQSLAKYIRFSKTLMKVVIASFIISFMYNIVGISFAAMGYLTPIISAILMPLSSVSVVAFVTLATTLLARNVGIYRSK
jgi:Cu+-exporting ATPase